MLRARWTKRRNKKIYIYIKIKKIKKKALKRTSIHVDFKEKEPTQRFGGHALKI